MFRGTATNKVDSKGRVSVPAEIRAVLLEEDYEGLICYPSFTDACLEAGGPAYFDKLHSYIDLMDPYDEMRDAFELSIIADSVRLSFDKDGRITLTGVFDHAEIDDYVTFVGRGEKFQMWNPSVYERRRFEARRMASENRTLLQRARTGPGRTGGSD
jgi:MraZ protein